MVKLVLLGVVAPTLLCAVVLLGVWRPWRRNAAIAGGFWGGAIGFGAGMSLAFWPVGAWSRFPPTEDWHWLACLTVGATLLGLADAVRRWPEAVRWVASLLFVGAAGWLLVGDWVARTWVWRPITAAAVLLVCRALNTRAANRASVSIPLAVCGAGLGASVILMLSGNAKLAQLAGALTSCLGVVVVLAWWRPEISLARGAAPVTALMFPGLLLSGYFLTYSEIPAWCFVLAAVAPVALVIDGIPGMSSLRPARAAALRVGAVLLAVLVALAAALLAGESEG